MKPSLFQPRMYYRILNEFLSSANDFKLIYTSELSKPFVRQTTKRICVLDSSFNPPHLGHYSLAIDSINQTYDKFELTTDKVLLLMLSVKNADKLTIQPAPLEERIDMMCLMADNLSHVHGIKVGVGLTKHAKFVDKSSSILKHFKDQKDDLKLTFSMGFDTLIRVFNPKYYSPATLENSLSDFMKSTSIFCLTRDDENISVDEQLEYISNIADGKNIPSHWTQNIYLKYKPDDNISKISSSNIREYFRLGKVSQWESFVISDIKDYLILNSKF